MARTKKTLSKGMTYTEVDQDRHYHQSGDFKVYVRHPDCNAEMFENVLNQYKREGYRVVLRTGSEYILER